LYLVRDLWKALSQSHLGILQDGSVTKTEIAMQTAGMWNQSRFSRISFVCRKWWFGTL